MKIINNWCYDLSMDCFGHLLFVPMFSHVSFWCIYYNQTNKSIILNGFHFSRSLIEHFRTFWFAFVSTSLLFVPSPNHNNNNNKEEVQVPKWRRFILVIGQFIWGRNGIRNNVANRSKRTEGSIDYNETTCWVSHIHYTLMVQYSSKSSKPLRFRGHCGFSLSQLESYLREKNQLKDVRVALPEYLWKFLWSNG